MTPRRAFRLLIFGDFWDMLCYGGEVNKLKETYEVEVAGYCPTQKRDYTITVLYTSYPAATGGSIGYMKTPGRCEYADSHRCPYAIPDNPMCPLVTGSPSEPF